MKKFILGMLLLSLNAAYATPSQQLIRVCDTVITMPGNNDDLREIPTTVEFYKNGNKYSSKTIQTMDGMSIPQEDAAEVIKGLVVRPNLSVDDMERDLDDLNMNIGEQMILHAKALTEDPVFRGAFSTGMNLNNVRNVDVYIVGEQTNMGSVAVIEARDDRGLSMGSFLGGFLVSPCK